MYTGVDRNFHAVNGKAPKWTKQGLQSSAAKVMISGMIMLCWRTKEVFYAEEIGKGNESHCIVYRS